MNETMEKVTRRGFLVAGVAAAAAVVIRTRHGMGTVEAYSLPATVRIAEFTDAGKFVDVKPMPTVTKTDAQWKAQLTPDAYNVTREEGTERAYTGPNWNNHNPGMYRCVCCDTALFNANTKFDSGTGWPSFWQPIAKENVRESTDGSLGMERTKVNCRRCDAHLGHVFDDGPKPTGLRYCMNGVAMKYVKFA